MRLKIAWLLFFSCIISTTQAQSEIKTRVELTNTKTASSDKSILYQKFSCPKGYLDYLFTKDDATVIFSDGKSKSKKSKVKRSDFKYNKRSGLMEYYYSLGKVDDIPNLSPFTISIVSKDGANFTKDKISKGDIKKLKHRFREISATSNQKKKLKKFKRTGDSQGQLMGDNQSISIKKRMKCSVKKREFRKNGVNGVKEMTNGM